MTEDEILHNHLSNVGKKGNAAMRKKYAHKLSKFASKGGKNRWKKPLEISRFNYAHLIACQPSYLFPIIKV